MRERNGSRRYPHLDRRARQRFGIEHHRVRSGGKLDAKSDRRSAQRTDARRRYDPRSGDLGLRSDIELDERPIDLETAHSCPDRAVLEPMTELGVDDFSLSAVIHAAYDKAARRCDWALGTLGPGQSRSVTINLSYRR